MKKIKFPSYPTHLHTHRRFVEYFFFFAFCVCFNGKCIFFPLSSYSFCISLLCVSENVYCFDRTSVVLISFRPKKIQSQILLLTAAEFIAFEWLKTSKQKCEMIKKQTKIYFRYLYIRSIRWKTKIASKEKWRKNKKTRTKIQSYSKHRERKRRGKSMQIVGRKIEANSDTENGHGQQKNILNIFIFFYFMYPTEVNKNRFMAIPNKQTKKKVV